MCKERGDDVDDVDDDDDDDPFDASISSQGIEDGAPEDRVQPRDGRLHGERVPPTTRGVKRGPIRKKGHVRLGLEEDDDDAPTASRGLPSSCFRVTRAFLACASCALLSVLGTRAVRLRGIRRLARGRDTHHAAGRAAAHECLCKARRRGWLVQ